MTQLNKDIKQYNEEIKEILMRILLEYLTVLSELIFYERQQQNYTSQVQLSMNCVNMK
jgi:hypothetical protein